MAEITIRPAQVAAWGRAAVSCGGRVSTAKSRVTDAEQEVATSHARSLRSVGAADRFCDHWETQLGFLRTDVTGTGRKLVSTAHLASAYDDESADPFAEVTRRIRPGEQP